MLPSVNVTILRPMATPKTGAIRMNRMEAVATDGVARKPCATWSVNTATTSSSAARQKSKKIWRPA